MSAADAVIIDVWDTTTFDEELRSFLARNAELIRSDREESKRLYEAREAQTVRGVPTPNRYAPSMSALAERTTALMAARTIRAWHFTRLADHEIAAVHRAGMQPMTLDLIRKRLDAAVEAGCFDHDFADWLYQASPYHHQLDGNRENRIWLTAQPYPLDSSSVEELHDRWGGESISFTHRKGATLDRLKAIGTPCVIEVALPMRLTTRIEAAATNVIDAFAKSIGADEGWGGGADMVAVEPICPDWILAVHRRGDPAFEAMGRGYPAGFKSGAD